MSTCPGCRSIHTKHSGNLHVIIGDDGSRTVLDEPAEIRFCLTCGLRYRADGVPFDSDQNQRNAARFGFCAACCGIGFSPTVARYPFQERRTCQLCNARGGKPA